MIARAAGADALVLVRPARASSRPERPARYLPLALARALQRLGFSAVVCETTGR